MIIYNINKFFILKFIIFLLLLFSSCSNNNEIVKNIIDQKIEYNEVIKRGNYIQLEQINNFWQSQNIDSYIYDYQYNLINKVNFGKGLKNYQTLISNLLIYDNYIFLIDNKGKLSKYNIQNKEFEWQKEIETENSVDEIWPISIINSDEYLIVTSGDGTVKAFDHSGNFKWKSNFNMTIRTPSYLINNLILIFLNNGDLISLDLESGEQIWKFNKLKNKISSISGGQLFKYENLLLAISPKGEIHIIDYFFGEYPELDNNFNLLFKPLNINNFDYLISLNIFDNKLIIIENNESYTTYDLLNNEIIIDHKNIQQNQYSKIINNSIITFSNDNFLKSYNISNGNIFWQTDMNDLIKSKDSIIKIIETNDFFVVFTSNGLIFHIERNTGSIINKFKLKLNNISSIYLHKNYIFFITEDATMYIYE